jgi:quinol monooxygenase YgiN
MAKLQGSESSTSLAELLVTIEFTALPGGRHDLEFYLTTLLPDTRAFNGCLGVTAFTSETAEDAVVIQERWQSSDAYDAYVAWREQRDDMAPLLQLVSGPPIRRRLKRIDL